MKFEALVELSQERSDAGLDMIKKINQTIEKYNLLEKGERVVVALSGGPDSTALLAVLVPIAQVLDIRLIVAHFNHRLRGGESDEDEKFSRALSKKMGLTFVSGKIAKTGVEKGISPEDYYRRQRYNFLNKVADDHQAQKIALGHNRNPRRNDFLHRFSLFSAAFEFNRLNVRFLQKPAGVGKC